jgi:hypothetical protein
MDRVAKQLAAYRRVPTDAKGQAWGKVRILEALEDDLADGRVLDFFLAVVGDTSEFDMARCRLLEYLGCAPVTAAADRHKVGECLARALPAEENWTVRCWLGRAAGAYGDVPELLQVATERVLDPAEDEDVRFNCLEVLTRLGPTPAVVAAFRQLAGGKDLLAQSVRSKLHEWGQTAEPGAAPDLAT